MIRFIHRIQRMNTILFILCLLFSSILFAQYPKGFDSETILNSRATYGQDRNVEVYVGNPNTKNQDKNMTPMINITVSGHVVNSVTGAAIEGALVTLDGDEHYEVYTDAIGNFTILQVFSGRTYTLKVLKSGYAIHTQQVTIGTTNLVLPNISLDQGPGTIETYIGNPASTTTSYELPINFNTKSSLSQTIYMADELSSEYYIGAGTPIISIKYFMTLAGDIPANKPLKVWIANTNISSFASTSSWLPYSEFTLVWDGNVDLSGTGGHELEFELDEPFIYEGENLVVMIQRPLDSASYDPTNKFKITANTQYSNRTLYFYTDNANINPAFPFNGYLTNAVPNTELLFVTSGFASLSGTVTANDAPLSGVKVAVQGTNRFAMTNTSGEYEMVNVPAGIITLIASKNGYNDEYAENVLLIAEQNTVQDFALTTMTNVEISGQVNNSITGQGISNAIVKLSGYEDYETFTDATGAFAFLQVFSGRTYTLKVLKSGYTIHTQQVTIGTADLVIPTINLDQGPVVVDAYVGNPTSTTNSYQYPVNFYYKSSLSQAIYMADELSSEYYIGAGTPIISIKYFMTLAGNIPANKPLKVWMANTNISSFASTSSWLPYSEFTLVWDGNVDLSGIGAHELEFELNEPFIYEGGNLVIMIQRPLDNASYDSTNKFKFTANTQYLNRLLYYFVNGSETDPQNPPSGYLATTVPNTELAFVMAGFATLSGTVSSANGPLADARVAIVGTNRYSTTNVQGHYQLDSLIPGTVTIKTSCQGYNDEYTEGIVLIPEQATVQNITLTPMTQISITGFVKNAATQAGISAAEIRLIGNESYSAVTSSTGAFTFPSIYSGQTYVLKVLKPGYEIYTMDLVVGTTNMVVPDIMVNQGPATVEAYVGNPSSSTSITYYPINLNYKNSYTQALYMQDEICSQYYLGGGTPIHSITYYANLYGDAPASYPTLIWIGNTTKSSFTSTSDWINIEDMTLVFDNTLNFSQAGQQEFEIILDEPFPYEGDNLVIAVLRPIDSEYHNSANKWYYTATPQYPDRTMYYYSDSVIVDPNSPPAGTRSSNVSNTMFAMQTSGFATLRGNTTENNAPLAGVKVAVDGTNNFAMSDAQGNYAINYAPVGQNNITASKFGYYNSTVQLNMPADEITTHNFSLIQLPNVTVTGVVHGSDTGAGLSNATVSLSGYENYQTTTNANGEFTIPGVYAAQTYTIDIVRAGYQNYTGQAVVGDDDTELGTFVMSEFAYPVTNVFAEISGNTVILSWNAPQIPNGSPNNTSRKLTLDATDLSKAGSHKIIISKDAYVGNTLVLDKENNTNIKEKTNNTRAITGYAIWRTPAAGIDNQGFWTSIQNDYDGLSYTDQSWAQCPSGEYKYIVKAIYSGNVLAEPAFSNTVAKDMMATVTFNLSTDDGQSASGAYISLINANNNPEQSYSVTATSNTVVIPNVWLGVYNLKVTKTGYMPYVHNYLVINQVEYTYPTVINLQIGNIFFQEGFEDITFPPAGWTLIDADGDGHNWELAGGVQIPAHNGDNCTASASYDNSIGALTPDNYIISPMISLTTDALAYNLSYWVAPQDPVYYNEHYSVMISTTGMNIADFTTIIAENLTNTTWEQREYLLNNYIGENIYIAFRHHNSTDNFMIKIDEIEIEHTLANDEEIIVPVITQTALKGNYPNPFNPETSIAFDLANEDNVTIEIYNIKGQKVKTLVNDRFDIGAHSVVWNGKDDNGKNVGSGIYFYNMKSGKYTSTRKMILMK